MFLIDRMLIGGIGFVLDKIVTAVDQEMNDDTRLREELLAAQMRLELGEISEDEFARIERDLLARLREIQEQRQGGAATPHDFRGAEVEVTVGEEGPVEPRTSKR